MSDEPEVDADISALMRFYSVETLPDLVKAQAHHIEKLQAKLPPIRDVAVQRVRG